MKTVMVTVATVDYIPLSLISLGTARDKAQMQDFYLFVTNLPREHKKYVVEKLSGQFGWVNVLCEDDLEKSDKEKFNLLRKNYSKAEHANIAKFFAIKRVMSFIEEGDIVVFGDSDLYFLNGINVKDMIGESSVGLTPQLCSPVGDNEEHEVMVHGWINAGFMIFKKKSIVYEIIEYLISRISKRGLIAPFIGLSADQTWVSGLPYMFPEEVKVLHDKNLNVAYWNIKERRLGVVNGSNYVINDSLPLVFYHFSGFDQNNSNQVSKHSNILLDDHPSIKKLWKEYCDIYNSMIDKVGKFNDVAVLPNAEDSTYNRIRAHEILMSVNLYKTMPQIGTFTKIGLKADGLIKRFLNLLIN